MPRTILFLTLLFSLLATTVHAETITVGKRYDGKKTLEVPTYQLAFTVPAGWTGMLPPGTEWFHIGKDNDAGRVFMWATRASDAELRQTMSSVFPAADAVMLTPTTPVTEEAGALVADYDATDGMNQYKAHARAVRKDGVVMAIVAVAPAEKLGTFKSLAKSIQKTVKFGVKPKVAKPNGNVGNGAWAQELANKRVVRYSHGSGYSEKTQYLLCGSGNFYNSFNATSNSINGSGVAANRAAGTWSVSGNVLTLSWTGGSASQHQLENRGGKLFVDGQRWLRESYVCQ